ncbi:MAG: prepilin-type N-terminal cleavage/methylation domain-containing protein [Gammaproteobacteria bacterium]|nr:MAG: prepilin-type N-terminal cleavage/methylation domain-containing protein [Gammaproteobacteria bacterium]
MRIPAIHKGFTLIELAMVLFILALVLGGLMSPLSSRLEQADREETKELLNQIKESLVGYTLVNGHLPCPDCPDGSVGYCGAIDTNDPADIADGHEDVVVDDVSHSYANRNDPLTVATCAVEVGYLPFATLGVPGDDAWDHRIIYSVDQEFADDDDGTTDTVDCSVSATLGISFEICAKGDITVVDVSNNNVATEVPALVYSLGKNGQNFGGTAPGSTAELRNWWTTAGDKKFTSDTYVQAAGSEYDDILIWIPPSMLMYRMVTAERLP